MKKNKLKKVDIRYFLLPFLILTMMFAFLSVSTIDNLIEENYLVFEKLALSIGESYSDSLIKSKEAYSIITELLDEKLIIASQAVLTNEEHYDNEILVELAEKFYVDEIYIYNKEGEVIYSNVAKYIGWKADEGHPVYSFMVSNQEAFAEEIRQDTESGIYYKYGYAKRSDGTFVQIGILADNIYEFLGRFELQQFINKVSSKKDIKYAFFADTNGAIITSDIPQYFDQQNENQKEITHSLCEDENLIRTVINEKEVLQVCVPIYINEEQLGMLSIGWSTDGLEQQIKEIIFNGVTIFSIVIITIGSILFYAHRKNNSNIKIAYYDKLTGLPNNEYLIEYLKESIKNLGKEKKALFLLNCTNFKVLNMTYGFLYGDQILKQIVNKIKTLLEPQDMFFRFSADRFVLVIESYSSSKELERLSDSLVGIFNDLFKNETKHEFIKPQLAIVEIKDKNTSPDKILKEASLGLTVLDDNPNEHIVFYKKEMDEVIQRQEKIETAIKLAIDKRKESLYLVFQPKLDLKKNKTIGFEVLARLHIEALGNVSPKEFISIAEKKMLIFDLGRYILKEACLFAKKLEVLGFTDIKIAINISGKQLLRDDFLKNLQEIIESTKVNVNQLEFEITESQLFESYNLINEKLASIKKLGILISLDDFGTGFSSFARLRELNINEVKIDKYFIDKISDRGEEDLIVADIISMSHKMGLTVVAEGVETKIQKDYLIKYDCDIIQGYLFSKPLPENEAVDFLQNKNLYV